MNSPPLINAYVLLADPAWVTRSISSYYPNVKRLIACYDRDSLSWSGQRVDVKACIELVRSIDTERKVVFVPGRFSDPDANPLELDTRQRQVALDAASDRADWVLQLDTDEVVTDWPLMMDRLQACDNAGLRALWYPQRTIYARASKHIYFEAASRRFRSHSGHPGAVLVRPGTRLILARQDDSPRVLLRIGRRAPDVPKRSCIVHLTWIRSREAMLFKASTSGHSGDFDWAPRLAAWQDSHQQPIRFFLRNLRSQMPARLRPCWIGDDFDDPLARFGAPRSPTTSIIDEPG